VREGEIKNVGVRVVSSGCETERQYKSTRRASSRVLLKQGKEQTHLFGLSLRNE
jgi:hypothetical protein